MNDTGALLQARVGDAVAIQGHDLAEPERLGGIRQVFGRPDQIQFRVCWDDEHERIFYPGNDATIRVHQRRREVKKR